MNEDKGKEGMKKAQKKLKPRRGGNKKEARSISSGKTTVKKELSEEVKKRMEKYKRISKNISHKVDIDSCLMLERYS
jgi:hypothetical protein